MAAAAPADAKAEAAKMDLLEDDDEFEEFEIDQGWGKRRRFAAGCVRGRDLRFGRVGLVEWDDKEDGDEAIQQWEDDWDDDDVNDDFSLQLRKELEECNTQKI
ncbi:hypothetical protein [Oryza sativa Japonica Group]|uniref:26S proteasome complex subunit SEM1 n=1 Tax=Oryza sativa subsp. japonica TaxID=39947 RepID=Q9LIY2_ORYSJ|nr:hypothetical protein [Oryza sativa Japonica Group]